MVRALASVILGYMGMAVWVMMALGIAWQLLGEDFAVDSQTNRATAAWIALNLPLSFLGALLGGWLGKIIQKNTPVIAGVQEATMETIEFPSSPSPEPDSEPLPVQARSQS